MRKLAEAEQAVAEIADKVDSFAIDEALALIDALRTRLRGSMNMKAQP